MKELVKCENRLKNIMLMDKQEVPQRIVRVVKAELLYVLKNYFDVSSENMSVDISLNATGQYVLSMVMESDSIKVVNTLN
ncbi:MAG: hypothetical protein E7356_04175 [Clostridiales bacterium]|nr:hypothetical protein [Clostridiales bacterium]